PTHTYPLSLHDALPIYHGAAAAGYFAAIGNQKDYRRAQHITFLDQDRKCGIRLDALKRRVHIIGDVEEINHYQQKRQRWVDGCRSEEHTSELQSRFDLV